MTSAGAVLTVVPVSALGTRLATLYWFSSGNPEGWNPKGLALGADGKLYGTTEWSRGVDGYHGKVFSLSTNGEFTIVAAFRGTNGSQPQAALVQGADAISTARPNMVAPRTLARCSS